MRFSDADWIFQLQREIFAASGTDGCQDAPALTAPRHYGRRRTTRPPVFRTPS